MGGESKEIGEDAPGRDVGAGPWSLNDQGIVVVATRAKRDEIVGRPHLSEGVRLGIPPHTDRGRAVVSETPDVSEDISGLSSLSMAPFDILVEDRECVEQLFSPLCRSERFRDQALDVDVG